MPAIRSEAGFTTVRDLGSFRAFTDCALRDAIELGDVVGPRMQCAGAFITAPWGGGDVVGLARDIVLPEELRFGVVRSVDEVRERVRRLLIGGATMIKCIGTGAVLTRGGVPGAPGAQRGRDPGRGRGGRLVRHPRRRPRPRRRGREAGDPGRRALGRARLVPRRRGDRDARRHGHVLQRRPVRRRVGARAGRPDATGRPRRCASCASRRSAAETVFGEGDRGAASGSRSGPTAASTRTA